MHIILWHIWNYAQIDSIAIVYCANYDMNNRKVEFNFQRKSIKISCKTKVMVYCTYYSNKFIDIDA
jgi:hypothetical protein